MFGHQQPLKMLGSQGPILREMPCLVTGDHEFFDTEHAFKLNTFGYFWFIYIYVYMYIIYIIYTYVYIYNVYIYIYM